MRQTAGGSYRLVLLRHGQSEWNARNLFTGWVNVPLTEAGEREAVQAGRLLAAHRLLPGLAHTSVQRWAIRTGAIVKSCGSRSLTAARLDVGNRQITALGKTQRSRRGRESVGCRGREQSEYQFKLSGPP
jgi:bisphosphoglycerate-dependent phosphoglycerate mutase